MDYNFFMKKALMLGEKALKAGEFPVGCVIVYEGRVISTGARISTAPDSTNELDHAEIIALRGLAKIDNNTYKKPGLKIDKNKVTLFSTLEPCLMCYGAILINGISKIVYAYEDPDGGGTGCDLANLAPFYKNIKPDIIADIMRKESLKLFKAYFSNKNNKYLRESFFAEYTLSAR